MAGTSVYNTQHMARLGKVVVHPLYRGGGRVGKVDGHRSAHRGAHLIHQAARLSEVDIFCILANLGDGDRVQSVSTTEMIENIP